MTTPSDRDIAIRLAKEAGASENTVFSVYGTVYVFDAKELERYRQLCHEEVVSKLRTENANRHCSVCHGTLAHNHDGTCPGAHGTKIETTPAYVPPKPEVCVWRRDGHSGPWKNNCSGQYYWPLTSEQRTNCPDCGKPIVEEEHRE